MGPLCQVVGSPSNGRESDRPTEYVLVCLSRPASLLHSYTQAGEMCSSKRECPCPRESLCWVCHLIKLQASEATECGVTDFILQTGLCRDASQASPCSHRARAGEKHLACVRSSPSITPALVHSAFCMRGSIRNHPSTASLRIRLKANLL